MNFDKQFCYHQCIGVLVGWKIVNTSRTQLTCVKSKMLFGCLFLDDLLFTDINTQLASLLQATASKIHRNSIEGESSFCFH